MDNGGGLTASAGLDVHGLHERLLRDRSLQFDFTALKPPDLPHLPPWLKAVGEFLAKAFTAAFPCQVVKSGDKQLLGGANACYSIKTTRIYATFQVKE